MSRMPLTTNELKGVIAAIPTPFTEKDEVDEDALRRIIDFLVENQIHGIMTTGGNGEFPHLLPEERKRVLEVTLDQTPTNIPVIACTSTCSAKETIYYTKHAKDVGANAVIILPPYYFRLLDQSLYEYYRVISDEIDMPIVVYNNPKYTGNNIGPELMKKIEEIDNVIGLKQSNYDISQTLEIIRLVGDRISVLTGIDSQLFLTLCLGGKGVFSTASCVIPREMLKIYEAFHKGDMRVAFDTQMTFQKLNRFFEYDPGYVAPCKEALAIRGYQCGHTRSPLSSLTSKEREELEKAMKSLHLC